MIANDLSQRPITFGHDWRPPIGQSRHFKELWKIVDWEMGQRRVHHPSLPHHILICRKRKELKRKVTMVLSMHPHSLPPASLWNLALWRDLLWTSCTIFGRSWNPTRLLGWKYAYYDIKAREGAEIKSTEGFRTSGRSTPRHAFLDFVKNLTRYEFKAGQSSERANIDVLCGLFFVDEGCGFVAAPTTIMPTGIHQASIGNDFTMISQWFRSIILLYFIPAKDARCTAII